MTTLKLERMDREKGLRYTDARYIYLNTDQIETFEERTPSSTDVTLASGGRYLISISATDLARALNPENACPEPDRCSYVSHYLAYGPADLTHGGYHAAEKLADQHMRDCRLMEQTGICSACTRHEERLRA